MENLLRLSASGAGALSFPATVEEDVYPRRSAVRCSSVQMQNSFAWSVDDLRSARRARCVIKAAAQRLINGGDERHAIGDPSTRNRSRWSVESRDLDVIIISVEKRG